MAELRATAEQQAAIDDRGGQLLVSAAAGSGKTKVLVDRLIGYLTDPDDPANIDEFLIITYTRAAAAELRSKIAARIAELLADRPEDRHLQRQLTRVYLAQISTVHAFCQSVLRQYAAEADLPADFRVADEQQAAVLRAETLRRCVAELYDRLDEEPDFAAMVDTLGFGRDDRRLLALAEESYTVMRCRVDPDSWMNSCLQAYELQEGMDAGQTLWGAYFMDERARLLRGAASLLQQAIALCRGDEKLEAKCEPILQKNLADVQALAALATWDACVAQPLAGFGVMRGAGDADRLAQIKALRKQAWEMVKEIQGCLYADSARVVQDLRRTLPALRGLLALLRLFDERFTQEKRRRKLLDFSDLEHCTIRLLTTRAGAPTAAARSLSSSFREILVDEYQDSNAVQECIFSAISREGRNLFLVGDVKQSIYRFRLADPSIFLRKYDAYPMLGAQAEGAPRKLLLSRNFRSRAEILEAANDVFSLVMKKEAGELDYTGAEALVPGREFPQAEGARVELHCLNLTAGEDDDGSADKTACEAQVVAERIAQLLQGGACVTDGDGLRPARASDIVILMRSPGMQAAAYQAALAARGIASDAGVGADLFETAEIEILMQLLQIVDNPHRDIPLAAAMASPVFAFSPEELALCRAENRRSDLYDCLCAAGQPPEKLQSFLAWLAQMRTESQRLELAELVRTIIRTSGLESVFAAMPDGVRRLGNLEAFEAFVSSGAQTDVHSLSQLVHLLEQLRARGAQLTSPPAQIQADAVRIMSIHRSKGLEFPIVILADLSRRMNLQDNQSAVLTDDALLLGGNVVDLASRSYYPSLARTAIMRRKTQQTVSEELRVLYVAMTRAKDMLIMTSCSAHLDTRLGRLRQLLSDPLLPCVSASARRLDDWILMAALCRTEAGALFAVCGDSPCSRVRQYPWHITLQEVSGAQSAPRGEAAQAAEQPEAMDLAEAERSASFQYAHLAASRVPSKLTATQLKGRFLDEEAAEQAPAQQERKRSWRRPQFLLDGPLTGREKGSATHLFMQFVRYACCTTEEGVRQELARLQAEKFLTPRQAEAVEVEKILALFAGALGQRILAAQKLRREFKFSILTDAGQYAPSAAGEQVMLQGVVDCFWQETDGLVIVDFKTDAVTNAGKAAERYAPQLHAYAGALARIYELPVKQTILYFFASGETIIV